MVYSASRFPRCATGTGPTVRTGAMKILDDARARIVFSPTSSARMGDNAFTSEYYWGRFRDLCVFMLRAYVCTSYVAAVSLGC